MKKILPLCCLAGVLAFAGCSDTPTDSDSHFQAVELPESYLPPDHMMGTLEYYAEFGNDLTAQRPVKHERFRHQQLNDDEYDIYSVTFLWGHLAPTTAADAASLDWSGTLSANAEVLIEPWFTILFDEGEDYLVDENDPAMVEWVSACALDIDGISFKVKHKPGNHYTVPPVLIFEAAAITVEVPFSQLDHYIAYYPVSNHGQGVAVLAKRIWDGSCPSGMLKGEWLRDEDNSFKGRFNGLWLDDNGEPIGQYVGHYWQDPDSENFYAGVFEGSVSGLVTDEVIAEFHGTWWFDDLRLCPMCGDDRGKFVGRVRWLENDAKGWMRGGFGDLTAEVGPRPLPMTGVWKQICHYADAASSHYSGD